MKYNIFISLVAVLVLAIALPLAAQAQDTDPGQAAQSVEAAIQDAMGKASSGNGPTLGQLGGVQGGSTSSDASGGAGGESSGGSGGGGGGGCFAPDTLVLMADGSTKSIADIVVGDKVASWDFGKNAQTSATVLHLYTVQRDYSYIVDGISVTAEHPFCTAPGQFTEVQFLKVGTKVGSVSGGGLEFVPVVEFDKVDEAGTFHNMTVDGSHTYIVSPESREREREKTGPQQGKRGQRKRLIVHNKGSADQGND